MKVAMLNGSPKGQSSNSGYLLELLQRRLPQDWEFAAYKPVKPSEYARALAEAPQWDLLVISFPLYVDSLPSHLLKLLAELEPLLRGKNLPVYAMVNCGFFEGRQNALAVEIVKNFCMRAGLKWGGALATGGGEMLGQTKMVPMGHGPNKNIGRALKTMAENIVGQSYTGEVFINPSFPRPLFIFAANRMWGFMITKNGLKRKDLYKRAAG